ncbi:uncharacterized protein LOC121800963 [Salvia splendens]|uniref:uncharacterized protein LOC121800963 n=1 Tax=Salvia splendens TaxID=180675 RepID=UPI001C26D80C|nr:uncharacterized protein LOC121800963 [Salvia splendens]
MVYRCRRKTPVITHLFYADDIIIFLRAHREAVEKLVGCLDHYIAVSGQMVKNGKTHFYLVDEYMEFADIVEEVGGFQRRVMPFTYLGVPIFQGARRADHLLPLKQKLMDRIHSWSHRHLAFGGRLALIKSMSAAIPLHILQVMNPLLGFLDELETSCSGFSLGSVHDPEVTCTCLCWPAGSPQFIGGDVRRRLISCLLLSDSVFCSHSRSYGIPLMLLG